MIARWAADNLWLIMSAAALLLLVGVALFVVSLIAQGGLVGATADYANGRSSSLARAWRTGVHFFWRYAGLWLLTLAAVAVIGAVVAAFVGSVVGLTAVVQNDAWVMAPALVVGLLLFVSGITAGFVASIVVPFAQRAIAVQDIGPLAALRDGWRVLRSQPRASLAIWLINLALSMAAGLAITVAMAGAILVLSIPGAALWTMFQLSAPTVAYIVVAAIVALGVLLTLISVVNTFVWSYWTLAYLRLRPLHAGDALG